MKIKWKNLTLLSLSVSALFNAATVAANPEGGQVISGVANIEQQTNLLKVQQSTQNAVLEWQSFNIDRSEQTQFSVPASDSLTINRVQGNSPSTIAGQLTSNGKLVLINQSGLIFTEDSEVNASSFTASTLDIDTQNLENNPNQYRFKQTGQQQAQIENLGKLSVKDKGTVLLLGSKVNNKGEIVARRGNVVLASGKQATIDFTGDGKINFAITEGVSGSGSKGVSNEGRIEANGGTVLITAENASDVISEVINLKGVVKADTVENQEGHVILKGGQKGLVRLAGLIESINEDLGNDNTGNGGNITVTGEVIEVDNNARLNVSSNNNAGKIRIGGDYQGKGDLDNAQQTTIHHGAVIKANSTNKGDGGKVIVWADKDTHMHGTIEANAGPNGGNGGFVETSGKENLIVNFPDGKVTASASEGYKSGTWLLDPTDLTVNAALATSLNTALNTTNVILETSAAGGGNGDIFFTNNGAPISIPSGKKLDVLASRNIDLGSTRFNVIQSTGGATLNLTTNKDATQAVGTGSITGTAKLNNLSGMKNSAVRIYVNQPTLDANLNSIFTDTGFPAGQGGGISVVRANGTTVEVRSIINNYAQLQAISTAVNSGLNETSFPADVSYIDNWVLIKDISGGSVPSFIPIGNDTQSFQGTLDGNNFFFKDFVLTDTNGYQGIFGLAIANDPSVPTFNNINITNTTIDATTKTYTGSLLGQGQSVYLNNIWVQGQDAVGGDITLNGDSIYMGGIAGAIFGNSTLNNLVSSIATITNANTDTTGGTGGLIGFIRNTTGESATAISLYNSSGKITAGTNVGGIIGRLESNSTTLDTLSNASKITAVVNDSQGGIIGTAILQAGTTASLNNAYNGGIIDGANLVGGLIGSILGSGATASTFSLSNSVNMGEVKPSVGGNSIGGLIGDSTGVQNVGDIQATINITGSANLGQITGGSTSIGGIIGNAGPAIFRSVSSLGTINGNGGGAQDQIGGFIGTVAGATTITDSASYFRYNGIGTNTSFGGLAGLQNANLIVNNTFSLADNTTITTASSPGGFANMDVGRKTAGILSYSGAVFISSTKFNGAPNQLQNLGGGFFLIPYATMLNQTLANFNNLTLTTGAPPLPAKVLPLPINSPYVKKTIWNSSSNNNISFTYPGAPNTSTMPLITNANVLNLFGGGPIDVMAIVNKPSSIIVNGVTLKNSQIPILSASGLNTSLFVAASTDAQTFITNNAVWNLGSDIRDLEKISRKSLGTFAAYDRENLKLNNAGLIIPYTLPSIIGSTVKTIVEGAGGTSSLNAFTVSESNLTQVNLNGSVILTDNGPLRKDLTLNNSNGDVTYNHLTAVAAGVANQTNFGKVVTLTANPGFFTLNSTNLVIDRDLNIVAKSGITIGNDITANNVLKLYNQNGTISTQGLTNLTGLLDVQTTVGAISGSIIINKGAQGVGVNIKTTGPGNLAIRNTTNATTGAVTINIPQGFIDAQDMNGNGVSLTASNFIQLGGTGSVNAGAGAATLTSTTSYVNFIGTANNLTADSITVNALASAASIKIPGAIRSNKGINITSGTNPTSIGNSILLGSVVASITTPSVVNITTNGGTLTLANVNNQLATATNLTTTTSAAGLNPAATAITVNGLVNATGPAIGANAYIGSGAVVITSGAGNISVAGTISSNGSPLAINTGGTSTVSLAGVGLGTINGTTIAVTAGSGGINLNPRLGFQPAYLTTGFQTYTTAGNITTSGNNQFSAGGQIAFNTPKIDGSASSFTVTAPTILLPLTISNTTNQTYNGLVTLNTNGGTHTFSNILTAGVPSGNIIFNNTVTSPAFFHNDLILTANTATLNLTTVANGLIRNLDLSNVPGHINVNTDVLTTGFQNILGPIALAAGTRTFDAGTNNITLGGMITGTGNTQDLFIKTLTPGTLSVNSVQAVRNLSVTTNATSAAAITLTGPTINTFGTQTYSAPVTLAGGTLLTPILHSLTSTGTAGNGVITFSKDITGTSNDGLSINTADTSSVQNISSVADLIFGSILPTVIPGGLVTINGTNIQGTGKFSFASPIKYQDLPTIFDNSGNPASSMIFYSQLNPRVGKQPITINSDGPVQIRDLISVSSFDLSKATNTIALYKSIDTSLTNGLQSYGGPVIANNTQLVLNTGSGVLTLAKKLSGVPINANSVTLNSTTAVNLADVADINKLIVSGGVGATGTFKGNITTLGTQSYDMPMNQSGDLVLKAAGFTFATVGEPIVSNDNAFSMISTKNDILVNFFNSANTVLFQTAGKLTTNNIFSKDLYLSGNLFNAGDTITATNSLTLSGSKGSNITNVIIDGFSDQPAAQIAVVAPNSSGRFLVNNYVAATPPFKKPPTPPFPENVYSTIASPPLQAENIYKDITPNTNNTDELISIGDAEVTLASQGFGGHGYFVKDMLPSAGILSGHDTFQMMTDEEVANTAPASSSATTTDQSTTKALPDAAKDASLDLKKRSSNPVKDCVSSEGSSVAIDCAL